LLLKGAERLQRRAASAHDVARTGHASTVRIQDANEDEDEDVTSTEGKLHVKRKREAVRSLFVTLFCLVEGAVLPVSLVECCFSRLLAFA
jgi:hypothetical protein